MYIYITSGTYPFLKKIKMKHSKENMLLMQSVRSAEIWHETEGNTVFKSPRKYEVLDAEGSFSNEGFVSCDHVPVRDENKPIFEFEFGNKANMAKHADGFIAARILRPLSHHDTYLIMKMWHNEKKYRNWLDSNDHHHMDIQNKMGNIFSGPAYTSTFIVSKDEIEKDDNELEKL